MELVTWTPGSRLCGKMADGGSVTARRCDSGPTPVSMGNISALTELEDLERVYQQLCVQEVGIYGSKHEGVSKLNFREATEPNC